MNNLQKYGWIQDMQHAWDELNLPDCTPARVLADFGTSLKISTPTVMTAELSGKMAHYTSKELTPKVGDWVAIRMVANNPPIVESVVFREKEIARKIAGKQITKQIIATNVDIAFVLLALDNDFSIERLQRFLFQLATDKISAVIVLNKSDKTDDIQGYVSKLRDFNIPIIITSAINGTGVNEILHYIQPGMTAILLGSSGVGKSTLTNQLLERTVQKTSEVRQSDSTGKHTTVHRELFILPNGGLLIDTPGIRELSIWGTEDNLEHIYQDIITLSARCKYQDCHHDNESGCAIRKALQNGSLNKAHYANYQKMKHELTSLTNNRARRIKKDNKRPRAAISWDDED